MVSCCYGSKLTIPLLCPHTLKCRQYHPTDILRSCFDGIARLFHRFLYLIPYISSRVGDFGEGKGGELEDSAHQAFGLEERQLFASRIQG